VCSSKCAIEPARTSAAPASVDARKCARLRRAARGSVRQHPGLTRIDVVALTLDADGVHLQHLRNAVTD
jgi:Holliday junction resolvase-like predicted endonuclease